MQKLPPIVIIFQWNALSSLTPDARQQDFFTWCQHRLQHPIYKMYQKSSMPGYKKKILSRGCLHLALYDAHSFPSAHLAEDLRITLEQWWEHRKTCHLMQSWDKAYFEGPSHLSVTHTEKLWACAWNTQPIGIDAEWILKPRNWNGIAKKWFTPTEQNMLKYAPHLGYPYFTQKEAIAKASHQGLKQYPMDHVSPSPWQLTTLSLAEHFITMVTPKSQATPPLILRWEDPLLDYVLSKEFNNLSSGV